MNTRIILSATWVVATLLYLYGDVLRIYHGGDMAKALADMKLNQFVWLGSAVLMMTPVLMVFFSLVLPQPVSRWANIIVAAFFFLFNLVGLPTIHRYLTNSCWLSAWDSTRSRSGMRGIGLDPGSIVSEHAMHL